ncbi:myotubularin-related protein 10-B-like isoform X2 [Amphiura filiformis]|uniref:myotubularin-related protein 10-B-like isoform X2 n=1 Tax=Amphiura filiformis TaxID=82378 RepID=UPI003B21CBCF
MSFSKGTFKSYLNSSTFVGDKKKFDSPGPPDSGIDEDEEESGGSRHPEMLEGEIIIGQAHNVLRFDAFSGLNKGISGSLYCTNFKVSFVSANKPPTNLIELDRRNQLFKENDIPLTCIESIWQVSSSRRRQLQAGVSLSSAVKMIEIRCKNFKVHTFSFKFTPKSQTRSIMNTIVYHAFPTNAQLLFAFAFKLPNSNGSFPQSNGPVDKKGPGTNKWKVIPQKPIQQKYTPLPDKITRVPATPPPVPEKPVIGRPGKTPQYRKCADWEYELKRTGARNLRVSMINQDFRISESLPEYFVVPSVCSDGELNRAAPHFEDGRVPFWSWSHSNGSMLMRMTTLRPDTVHLDMEDNMLESITLIHPSKVQPQILDLNKLCPSIREIQSSYVKIQEMCIPVTTASKCLSNHVLYGLDCQDCESAMLWALMRIETLKDFWASDERWLSSLDSSKWIHNISMCLNVAVSAATAMYQDETTVVLKEVSGRDLSCVVSSLVQMMLDPFSRSQLGFQSLIQREWVIAGHPFLDRCGHITPSNGEEAPVFLLFLDCVHQLMEQFPSAFEFTDTYLMTLWDSMFSGIFGTFVFNSEKQRVRTCRQGASTPIKLATVWAWTLQYSKNDQNLFNNPLYILRQSQKRGNNPAELALRQLVKDMQPDFTLGCNMGVYRSMARQRAQMMKNPLRSGRRTKKPPLPPIPPPPHAYPNPNVNGANSTSSNANASDPNILIPSLTGPFLQFWTACYLRWIPSVHIVGGGAPMLYKQQCELVDEIQHLKLKLRNLKLKSPPKTNGYEESNVYFTRSPEGAISKKNQQLLTSAFPYSISDLSFIGGDRRSFLGTPLARFLRGQSLLDTEVGGAGLPTSVMETDEVEL